MLRAPGTAPATTGMPRNNKVFAPVTSRAHSAGESSNLFNSGYLIGAGVAEHRNVNGAVTAHMMLPPMESNLLGRPIYYDRFIGSFAIGYEFRLSSYGR